MLFRSIGDKRAVDPMIALLKNPESFNSLLARKYTAYALAELTDARSVDVLIEMLHDRLHYEEEEIDGTIQVFDEPAIEAIEAAAGALIAIGEWRGLQAVIERLLENDVWFDHRLGEHAGEAGFLYLITSLNTGNENRRERAAALLGEYGDRRATSILIPLSRNDPSDRVRHSATYALTELRDPEAFATLLWALGDTYDQVSLYGAFGIRYLLSSGYYNSQHIGLTPSAMLKAALAEIGEDQLRERLKKALENQALPIVKEQAAAIQSLLDQLESHL